MTECHQCRAPLLEHATACSTCGTAIDDGRWAADEGGSGPREPEEAAQGHMVIEESARTPRTVFDSGSTPKKRLVAWLVTFVDNPAGQAYRLNEGTNTIGSDRECDLAFPHEPSIGRRHAVIVARHGKLLIQEGESSRLITVNGVGIAGRGALPLKNLDRIRIGLMDFRLHTVT